MLSRRKLFTTALVATSIVTLGACSSERAETSTSDKTTSVGISMPTRSLERWNNDGSNLESLLKEAGYETSLQYADNKTDQQITQIQNMINNGATILVIAAVDGSTLAPVLETAAEKDITVIAYDRLITDTENVDYYATFDNYQVGQLQGQFIVDQLELETTTETFNLEPFAGSSDDNNALYFFDGAWDVLLPYVESGKLTIPSGKDVSSSDKWTNVSIDAWSSQKAQSEMDNRLNSFYANGEKVDVVLSPNDSLALGIEQSLDSHSYTVGTDWPIITGQDADKANVLNMLAGKQSMTVWKDTRTLGEQVSKMITQIVNGETVETNDTETYDNGVKVVPSYLLPPQVVTKDTVQADLVDSEFYSADDLGL